MTSGSKGLIAEKSRRIFNLVELPVESVHCLLDLLREEERTHAA
jgi:hypothetical protein